MQNRHLLLAVISVLVIFDFLWAQQKDALRPLIREMAVTAAREKAAAIAEKLGQQIGKAFTIEEEEPVRLAFGNVTANSTGEASGMESDVTDSGLALGQITFRASIKISFELKGGL